MNPYAHNKQYACRMLRALGMLIVLSAAFSLPVIGYLTLGVSK